MNYNFTDRVRKVLAMAREEAVRLQHDYVGTEHILLGLIREGEGVAAEVLRNLAADLDDLLRLVEENIRPGKATTPIDCRVEIEVSRFDGKPGDSVLLESQWIIFSKDRRQVLGTKTSSLSEPVNGRGYEALVEAQSRALAALGRELAEAIRSLPRDAPEE